MREPHKIDFELADGIILIPGNVNSIDGYFAFDTGATQTVLNKTYYSGIHAENGKEAITFDNSVKSSDTSTASSASVAFGGMVYDLNNTTTMDMTYVETPLRTIKPELRFLGSIGADLITNDRLLIDYKNKQLVLCAPAFPENAKKVYMSVERLPMIELAVNDRSHRFVLDTGANHFVMDRSVAPLDQMIPSTDGSGTYTIPSISFSGKEYRDVVGLVADLSAMRQLIPADGIIGYQLLKDNICGFDFENECLYLW